MIEETFARNLAADGTVQVGEGSRVDPRHAPGDVLDGDPATYWTPGDDLRQASLVIELGEPTTFDRIAIQEHITLGQRVKAFAVEVWDADRWRRIASGSTIGHKRLLRLNPVTAQRVRAVDRRCLRPARHQQVRLLPGQRRRRKRPAHTRPLTRPLRIPPARQPG